MRSNLAIPLSLVVVSLALAALPSRVEASCVAPPPQLVWSYPADGATVPTNAVFWAIVPLGSDVRALLDGVELAPLRPMATNGSRFEPGPLAPGPHVVEFLIESGDGVPVLVPVSFVVGDGPADPAVGEVRLDDLELVSSRDLSAMCAQVIASYDCFDTGPNDQLALETDTRPVVWLVGLGSDPNRLTAPKLWPGDCGHPRIVVPARAETCASALAFDETGTARSTNPICSNGCGCSSASGAALLLPAWLLALVRRRRANDGAPR